MKEKKRNVQASEFKSALIWHPGSGSVLKSMRTRTLFYLLTGILPRSFSSISSSLMSPLSTISTARRTAWVISSLKAKPTNIKAKKRRREVFLSVTTQCFEFTSEFRSAFIWFFGCNDSTNI
jgi:hypothetical protein